jgi:hypothetical protein
MRRPPVLSATAWGEPMSATYPPEYQQSPSQPPPEVRPPRKRHRIRKTLLILGGGFAALIVLVVIINLATGGTKIKPAAAPSATPTPTPTVQSYPSAPALLAALAAHGAPCSGASVKSGGAVAGEINPFVDCNGGGSSDDTVLIVFTDHASALAYANSMISLGQSINTPTADVVGPNWTVNTVPGFAPKVVKAVYGQLIPWIAPAASAPATSAPATSAPATSAPAAPATSAPAAAPAGPTASQQQAIDAAQQYLSLGQGFSYQGLLQQLTSSYGSGFSASDANFAINYLQPDWDAQAVLAAKGYLALGGFSHDSLLQQLTSPDGGGFTYAQAEYALGQVGM